MNALHSIQAWYAVHAVYAVSKAFVVQDNVGNVGHDVMHAMYIGHTMHLTPTWHMWYR